MPATTGASFPPGSATAWRGRTAGAAASSSNIPRTRARPPGLDRPVGPDAGALEGAGDPHTLLGARQFLFHAVYLTDGRDPDGDPAPNPRFDFPPGINFEPWWDDCPGCSTRSPGSRPSWRRASRSGRWRCCIRSRRSRGRRLARLRPSLRLVGAGFGRSRRGLRRGERGDGRRRRARRAVGAGAAGRDGAPERRERGGDRSLRGGRRARVRLGRGGRCAPGAGAKAWGAAGGIGGLPDRRGRPTRQRFGRWCGPRSRGSPPSRWRADRCGARRSGFPARCGSRSSTTRTRRAAWCRRVDGSKLALAAGGWRPGDDRLGSGGSSSGRRRSSAWRSRMVPTCRCGRTSRRRSRPSCTASCSPRAGPSRSTAGTDAGRGRSRLGGSGTRGLFRNRVYRRVVDLPGEAVWTLDLPAVGETVALRADGEACGLRSRARALRTRAPVRAGPSRTHVRNTSANRYHRGTAYAADPPPSGLLAPPRLIGRAIEG